MRSFSHICAFIVLGLGSSLVPYAYAESAREIARKAFPSVVMLVMEDSHGQPTSLGSGFFVREDVVATNLHVIEGATTGYAKIVGKKPKYDIVGFVAIDRHKDLVLLKLKKIKVPTLTLGDSNDVAVGDEVYAVGNPQGLEGTFSKGIVSGIRKVGEDILLQITAPISPGSSGGPVLNTKGKVIGISVATFKTGQNLNFAIPVSYLTSLLLEMKSPKPISTEDTQNKKQSILNSVGGKSTEGIVATHIRVDNYWKTYSFSFRNKLREPVTDIMCLVVFYGPQREPLDTSVIAFREIILPGLAKRCSENRIENSVFDIIKGKGQKKSDLSEKFASCMEFRVLDFKISESDELSRETITPSQNSKLLRSHVEKLLRNLRSQDYLGLHYYLRDLLAEPHSKQDGQKKDHEIDPLKGQVKVARSPLFGIFLGENIIDLQKRLRITKGRLMGQDDAYYELWTVHHDSDAVDKCAVQTFLNRVVLISIFFKDGSERNFNVLKKQIEKKYRVRGHQPWMKTAWDCSAELDGIPIFIHVQPKVKVADVEVPGSRLSIAYVHWPLMEKSWLLTDQHRGDRVSDQL